MCKHFHRNGTNNFKSTTYIKIIIGKIQPFEGHIHLFHRNFDLPNVREYVTFYMIANISKNDTSKRILKRMHGDHQ